MDLDINEFLSGMKNLMNIQLNDEKYFKKAFNLMNEMDLIDSNNSGYIDKNDFIWFLTQKYETFTLDRLQTFIIGLAQ